MLLRDVTDLRSRDRELVTKDATIREIHHRVKNNLQTVAALLRLQARRMTVPEARAALEEAVRRVGSIALVHETLSQSLDESVDFDEIADRLRVMVGRRGLGGGAVTSSRTGRFGIAAGRGGHAAGDGAHRAAAERHRARLRRRSGSRRGVRRAHAGRTAAGPGAATTAGASRRTSTLDASTSLGLSIVRTLVESELGGSIEPRPAPTAAGHRCVRGASIPL